MTGVGDIPIRTGAWTDSSTYWDPNLTYGIVPDTSGVGGNFARRMECWVTVHQAENLDQKKEKKGMEEFLLDLTLDLGLTKEQVKEIREITGHQGKGVIGDGWSYRFVMYLLAKSVQDGLKLEDLGYKRDEE